MHDIEPYYNWRHQYTAEEDEKSPFFGRKYSEFEFSNTVYNYYIHPQWEDIGSRTLYLKILFADYDEHFCIIELIGEWNDAIENDIQTLKRNIIDPLLKHHIYKYILIGENVMAFYSDGNDYYAEWNEEVIEQGGWVCAINFAQQNMQEIKVASIHHFVFFNEVNEWRTLKPEHLLQKIENLILPHNETLIA